MCIQNIYNIFSKDHMVLLINCFIIFQLISCNLYDAYKLSEFFFEIIISVCLWVDLNYLGLTEIWIWITEEMMNSLRKEGINKLYDCLEAESKMTSVYPVKTMESSSSGGMHSAVCFYGLKDSTPNLST